MDFVTNFRFEILKQMVINNLKRYEKNKVSDSIPTKLENLR